jgi:hypothetical protein
MCSRGAMVPARVGPYTPPLVWATLFAAGDAAGIAVTGLGVTGLGVTGLGVTPSPGRLATSATGLPDGAALCLAATGALAAGAAATTGAVAEMGIAIRSPGGDNCDTPPVGGNRLPDDAPGELAGPGLV